MNQRIIYKITCIPTGMVYIGASRNPASRWSSHRSSLRKGMHTNREMQGDWHRYGEKAFAFRCIEIEEHNEDLEAVIIEAHRGYCYNVVKKKSGLEDMRHKEDVPDEYEAALWSAE